MTKGAVVLLYRGTDYPPASSRYVLSGVWSQFNCMETANHKGDVTHDAAFPLADRGVLAKAEAVAQVVQYLHLERMESNLYSRTTLSKAILLGSYRG